MKKKMIEAMLMAGYEEAKTVGDRKRLELEAALSVAADPANWTDEMQLAADYAANAVAAEFAAVIKHIDGLPT